MQSALWSRQSVNLFTAALYHKNEKCRSYLVVTHSQDKGKDSVYVFMMKLIKLFPSLGSNAKLVIYTDGPSSEFKNKFMVKFLSDIANQIGGTAEWKYFATSHGKGVVDGIGGSAKSLVRTKVMSKGGNAIVVQNSMDFAAAASDLMNGVTVVHVSKEEISQVIDQEKPWSLIHDVPGISKIHKMSCTKDGNLKLYKSKLDSLEDINSYISVSYNSICHDDATCTSSSDTCTCTIHVCKSSIN